MAQTARIARIQETIKAKAKVRMTDKDGKKTCMNCKFGLWKYDTFVCFNENMIKFVASSSTCDRYEDRQ